MNIGIYFNNTSESEPLYKALQRVNESLSEGTLRDASIFYDDSGPNSIPSKCGFFDAVELWHFTGFNNHFFKHYQQGSQYCEQV